MTGVERAIVDTNVMLVANRQAPQASADCVGQCVSRLQTFMAGAGRIVLDDAWRVLEEYSHKLNSRGQPGVGDAFYKWVLTNRKNPDRCEYHTLTPDENRPDNFEEFPQNPALQNFDLADRKMVALAKVSLAPIWNAVDSDWWNFREALQAEGVVVEFLCPAQFAD